MVILSCPANSAANSAAAARGVICLSSTLLKTLGPKTLDMSENRRVMAQLKKRKERKS